MYESDRECQPNPTMSDQTEIELTLGVLLLIDAVLLIWLL